MELNCGLGSMTATCISGQLVYQLSLCPRCVLKIHWWRNDTIYSKLLTTRVVHWNKLPGCWQLKDKKSTLSINNYLLKHNGIYTYLSIYIYGNYHFCCIWETDIWGVWLVQVFYLTQFFREWGFCWRGFRRNFLEKFLFLFSCFWYEHQISSLIWP